MPRVCTLGLFIPFVSFSSLLVFHCFFLPILRFGHCARVMGGFARYFLVQNKLVWCIRKGFLNRQSNSLNEHISYKRGVAKNGDRK